MGEDMSSDDGLYIYGEVLFDQFPDGSQVLGGTCRPLANLQG